MRDGKIGTTKGISFDLEYGRIFYARLKAGKIKRGDKFQDYMVISVTQEELVIGCHKFRMSYLMDFGSKNLQK